MPSKNTKNPPLSPAEQDVLRLLTEEFLTPKQIINRRQCSKQAVYKIIKKLKQKGVVNLANRQVDFFEAPVVNHSKSLPKIPASNYVRLHGQEINIRILWQDHRYQKQLLSSNLLYLEGHTIKLYKGAVEVYGGPGTSFYGENAQRAFSKSLSYWQRLITRLEHELHVVLVKPRSRNIRIVNQHFARGESEVYNHGMENSEKIRIYARDDGKLWFLCDDSFGLNEDETVHSHTSKPDREEVDKHLNDWRDHKPPTNSQLAVFIEKNARNLENYAVHLKSHVQSVQDLGEGVRVFTAAMESQIKELTDVIKDLRDKK